MTEEYRTFAGNSLSDFEAFNDAAQGCSPKTLQVTLRTTSRLVVSIAPIPPLDADDDIPADYLERAQDAGFLSRYPSDTDAGQTSSQNGEIGTSISYQSNPKVIELVQSAMGFYAEEEQEEDSTR